MKRWFATLGLMGFLCLGLLISGTVQAEPVPCQPSPFEVILATPFSSRIDRVGDPLQAVLSHPLHLPDGNTLPSGTLLKGKVTGIRPSDPHTTGQIQIRFTQAIDPTRERPLPFQAVFATPDGWLYREDVDTPVWHMALNRSTRLLNMMIQRRLGPDPTVWAQILGIPGNMIPDPSTDEFIQQYNYRDVLAGAGDTLQLRCESP